MYRVQDLFFFQRIRRMGFAAVSGMVQYLNARERSLPRLPRPAFGAPPVHVHAARTAVILSWCREACKIFYVLDFFLVFPCAASLFKPLVLVATSLSCNVT